uniref:G_PROTEIN_RECEP_F1_2 domain-containing protein n=1 Tax=Rhabditophanes sp. KR3021 TaxID=114890 RepID=A0AC35UD88_9BILA
MNLLVSNYGEYSIPDLNNQVKVDFMAHGIIMPIVLSIGLLNQCLNVATLSRLPSPGFLYLKASATADILSIIALIPFVVRHMHVHSCQSYLAMFYHVHLELPIINALITASALCIVAMTVDRYISICHPITFFSKVDSKSRIRSTIFFIYLIAFFVYIPSAWQSQVVAYPAQSLNFETMTEANDYCQWNANYTGNIYVKKLNKEMHLSVSFTGYLFVREAVSRIGPILILVILNLLMSKSLHKLNQRTFSRTSFRRSNYNDRNRISTLLVITSATFVICNLPASLLSAFKGRFFKDTLGYQIFRAVANLIQVTSYLYNFYLYALCSGEYRQAFMRLARCGKVEETAKTTVSKNKTNRTSKAQNIVPLWV